MTSFVTHTVVGHGNLSKCFHLLFKTIKFYICCSGYEPFSELHGHFYFGVRVDNMELVIQHLIPTLVKAFIDAQKGKFFFYAEFYSTPLVYICNCSHMLFKYSRITFFYSLTCEINFLS
jgi:hypothetical protein